MKYIVLFLSLCFLCSQPLFGQQAKGDTLVIKKNEVYRNGWSLSHKTLKSIMNEYPDSKKIMDQATSSYNTAQVFGFVGGFCIGYGVVSGIMGNKSGWAVAGAGVCVAFVSIPFSTAHKRQVRNAVDIYNDHLRIKPATLEVGTFSSGVGVRMRF
jgi:hypothetical protein